MRTRGEGERERGREGGGKEDRVRIWGGEGGREWEQTRRERERERREREGEREAEREGEREGERERARERERERENSSRKKRVECTPACESVGF